MNDLTPRARALEDALFFSDNPRLSESLHELRILEETSGLLAEVSGIADAGVLRRLAELGVTPAAAAGLVLVPLVAMAWADGATSESERTAIVAGLGHTLFFQTIDRDIVDVWLAQQPSEPLLVAWEAFACKLAAEMTEAHAGILKAGIVDHVRAVAQAAGRILGLGGTTASEKMLLGRVEGAFSSCP